MIQLDLCGTVELMCYLRNEGCPRVVQEPCFNKNGDINLIVSNVDDAMTMRRIDRMIVKGDCKVVEGMCRVSMSPCTWYLKINKSYYFVTR